MDTSDAYNFALNEMITRLNKCPVYITHDPHCECRNLSKCQKKVKCTKPTEWAMQPMQDYYQAYSEHFKKVLKHKMKYNKTKTKVELNWCFITINPKPNIKLPAFIKKLKMYLKTKIFADYLAVIEQREINTEALGKGFHAHILFKRHTPLGEGLPPTNIKRNIKQSWRNYCESNNPHILNIQFIGDDFAYDKWDYIRGVKLAEGKAEKQKGDRIWREKHNIPEYLGNNNIIQ